MGASNHPVSNYLELWEALANMPVTFLKKDDEFCTTAQCKAPPTLSDQSQPTSFQVTEPFSNPVIPCRGKKGAGLKMKSPQYVQHFLGTPRYQLSWALGSAPTCFTEQALACKKHTCRTDKNRAKADTAQGDYACHSLPPSRSAFSALF